MNEPPGGPGPLSWWQLGGAVFSISGLSLIIPAIWRATIGLFDRVDKGRREKKRDTLSLEDQLRAARVAEGIELGAQTKQIFDEKERRIIELRGENIELKTENGGLKFDRNRGWDLARHWYGRFGDAVAAVRQARSFANSYARRLIAAGLMDDNDMPTYDYTLPPLVPGLEEPFPKPVAVPEPPKG